MVSVSAAQLDPQGLRSASRDASLLCVDAGKCVNEHELFGGGGAFVGGVMQLGQSPYAGCLSRFFGAVSTAMSVQGDAVGRLNSYARGASSALQWLGDAAQSAEELSSSRFGGIGDAVSSQWSGV